jgi:hypothetical protein
MGLSEERAWAYHIHRAERVHDLLVAASVPDNIIEVVADVAESFDEASLGPLARFLPGLWGSLEIELMRLVWFCDLRVAERDLINL